MNALLKQVLEESKKPTSKDSNRVAVIARARGVELFPANDAPPPPPRPPNRNDNMRKRFIGKGLFN